MSDQRTLSLDAARRATSVGTQQGTISFGAPVSAKQYDLTREHFKGKDIVKTLKFKSAKQLGDFAAKRIARSDIPKEATLALSIHAKEIASALEVDANKFWTRKLACIAFILVTDRKSAARRKPRKQPDDVPAAA